MGEDPAMINQNHLIFMSYCKGVDKTGGGKFTGHFFVLRDLISNTFWNKSRVKKLKMCTTGKGFVKICV